MLASDTLESPCLCCPSAGAEPEGTWKVKDKGSLNLSDDNFHQENDAGSTPARSSQCGRSDLGQEVEPELFDRRLLLQTGAVSCITAVRGACGTAGEAALPAQPLSLHSCCSAECRVRAWQPQRSHELQFITASAMSWLENTFCNILPIAQLQILEGFWL